jgi:hypothetical protein
VNRVLPGIGGYLVEFREGEETFDSKPEGLLTLATLAART